MEDEKDKARSNWIIIQHMHTMAHPMNRKAGHANNNGFLTTTPLERKLFTFATVGETVHG